jgi:hypothetical protein
MLSPIQLRRHEFTQIHLETLSLDHAPEQESYSFDLKFGEPTKSDGLWHSVMEVRFEPEKGKQARYAGRLAVQGEFMVHPEFDPAKEEPLVRFNSGSLLLAAIREMLLMITSRSSAGPMELPTFNPQMFVQNPPEPAKPSSANDLPKRPRKTR